MASSILCTASGLLMSPPDADEAEIMLHKNSQKYGPRHLTCSLFVIPFIPVYKAFLTGMKGMRPRQLRANNHPLPVLPGDWVPVGAPRWLMLFVHKLFFVYSARPAQSLVLLAATGRAELS